MPCKSHEQVSLEEFGEDEDPGYNFFRFTLE